MRIALLTTVIILITQNYHHVYADSISTVAQDVCLSPGCVSAANRILELVDTTVRPCDNFFKYACGKFNNNTILTEGDMIIGLVSNAKNNLNRQLYSILNEQIDSKELKYEKLPKLLFQSCMNETENEKVGLKTLKKYINSFGGWPVLERHNDTASKQSWNWMNLTREFRNFGFDFKQIISINVILNSTNTSTRIIKISGSDLELNYDDISLGLQDEKVKNYYDLMVDMAVIFGAADKNRAQREMLDALNFELSLDNISYQDSGLDRSQSLSELQSDYPYIPWVEFIQSLYPREITFSEKEMVLVKSPKYLAALGDLLKNTPNRTIANYLIWRVICSSAPYLSGDVKNRYDPYKNTKPVNVHDDDNEARWKFCITKINKGIRLQNILGSLYVRNLFTELESTKTAVTEMVRNIRLEVEETLKRATWMDNETLTNALKKAKAMVPVIGYANGLLNSSSMESYFSDLNLHPTNFLQNMLWIKKFDADKGLMLLRKPVDKYIWTEYPTAAQFQAYYFFTLNVIYLPAAFFHDPITFSVDYPNYINYGLFGSTIGHEIIHGFDISGGKYAWNGDEVSWWSSETEKIYNEKSQCIVEQYSKFASPETKMTLNGNQTLGEDQADLVGLKLAYNAYKRWANQNEPEKPLPGVNFTLEQSFWLSTGHRLFCEVSSPDVIAGLIITDAHTISEYRVTLPLRNIAEFANDFSCPVGSPMNPAEKCELW